MSFRSFLHLVFVFLYLGISLKNFSVSAISSVGSISWSEALYVTKAKIGENENFYEMEREKGLEPSALSLGS